MFKKLSLVILVLGFMVTLLSGCGSGSDTKTLVVGTKDYTENIILGNMLAELIEGNTDYKVDRKINLGGTLVCFNSLKKGDLDAYVDYTGTGLMSILKREVVSDPDEVYNIVQEEYNKQFNIKWLKPLGFNNTYAMAVPQKLAEQHNLNKVSDLLQVDDQLVFGTEQEFLNRKDGFPGLKKAYDLNFKDVKSMQVGLKYSALKNESIQVMDAFSTDGKLISFNIKVLEDDKNFFPPYFAAPVVRMDTLKEYPELEEVLNKLSGKISDKEMQQLNYQVDEKGRDAAEVAKEFLKKKDLI